MRNPLTKLWQNTAEFETILAVKKVILMEKTNTQKVKQMPQHIMHHQTSQYRREDSIQPRADLSKEGHLT